VADKKVTTVRLRFHTYEQLRRATYVLGQSQSRIVEDALHEFFRTRNLGGGYQLTFTEENVVLLHTSTDKPPRVLDVYERNGVPPQEAASKYTAKLGEPVQVVVQEKGGE
jgi:hypothetical protein